MSSNRHFRISLHLGHFFNDHRCVSRIFINNRFDNVQDLEEHIKNLFNISNFHLICNNHYLPSTESIEILEPEEEIWVKPNDSLENNRNYEINSLPKPNLICKKTKKRKQIVEEVPENEENVTKSKSKKLKTTKQDEEIEDLFQNNEDKELNEKKRKKKKNKLLKVQNEDKCKGNNDVENIVDEKHFFEEKEETLSHNFVEKESNVITPKAKTEMSLKEKDISTVPCNNNEIVNSRINIIENKIVKEAASEQLLDTQDNCSNIKINRSKKNMSNILANTKNITDSQPLNSATKTFTVVDHARKDSKQCNNVEELINRYENLSDSSKNNSAEAYENNQKTNIINGNIENTDKLKNENLNSLSNGISYSDNVNSSTIPDDSFVTKRKRIRHRKRKSSGYNVCKNSFDTPKEEEIAYMPPNIQSTPTLHIKWSEDEDSKNDTHAIQNDVVLISDSNTTMDIKDYEKTRSVNKKYLSNSSRINNLSYQWDKGEKKRCINGERPSETVILPNDSHEEKTEESWEGMSISGIKADLTDTELNNEGNATKAFIRFPKTGEVISFKTLRISEDYTPQLSSIVVAKVLDFNITSKEIIANIVHGKDQLIEPEGKFFMDDENEKNKKDCVVLNWSNLIDIKFLAS